MTAAEVETGPADVVPPGIDPRESALFEEALDRMDLPQEERDFLFGDVSLGAITARAILDKKRVENEEQEQGKVITIAEAVERFTQHLKPLERRKYHALLLFYPDERSEKKDIYLVGDLESHRIAHGFDCIAEVLGDYIHQCLLWVFEKSIFLYVYEHWEQFTDKEHRGCIPQYREEERYICQRRIA